MSDVDALFRLLTAAPPRSAEIVKRVALSQKSFPELAALYGLDVPRMQRLAFRSFLDVLSGGTARVPDEREATETEVMLGERQAAQGEGAELRRLWQSLTANRAELEAQLTRAAAAFEASPDRVRDERLRWVAIAVVLALTAYFYFQQANKPHPPPQKRPTTTAPFTP